MSKRKLRSIKDVKPPMRGLSETSPVYIPPSVLNNKEQERLLKKLNDGHDRAIAADKPLRAEMFLEAGTRQLALYCIKIVLGMQSETRYRTREAMFEWLPWMTEGILYSREIAFEINSHEPEEPLEIETWGDFRTWLTKLQTDNREGIEADPVINQYQSFADEYGRRLDERQKFIRDMHDKNDKEFLKQTA